MNKNEFQGFFKRQTFVISLCVFAILLTTILTSAALYTASKESTVNQSINSSTFSVSFANSSGTINNDIFIESDAEGLERDGYKFKVTNSSNIPIGYNIILENNNTVSANYIRFSIDSEPPQTLANMNLLETNKYIISKKNLNKSTNITHVLRVWIDEQAPLSTVINKSVILKINVEATTYDPSNEGGMDFGYSGSLVSYTIPYTGVYQITAAGAEGGIGNRYGKESNTTKGGKGARISGEFSLNKGDVLDLVVGGMGSTTISTAKDGAAGAGGGGSYVFKKISAKDSSKAYQFTATYNSTIYDPLLVAAGGGGTNDIGYKDDAVAGNAGNASAFYSPTNYIAYSTTSISTATSSSSLLGIGQFIANGFSIKSTYTRSTSVCKTSFGGGSCSDDAATYGGGWYGTSTTAYSWSQGENTVGEDGVILGNGYINIKLIR